MYKEHLRICNKLSKQRSNNRVETAYEEWLITKSHIKKTAMKHNTDPGKLTKYILEKGHRLVTFNNSLFKKIDNEAKAYWLGFLFADGSINEKSNSLELSLQLSDKKHVEKFVKFLECNREVRTDSFRCRFSAGNSDMVQDLVKLGCTERKSLSIVFPKLSTNLIRHFIRGYFDGDGCITKSSKKDILYTSAQICSGSKPFLLELISLFNNQCLSNCKQRGYNPPNTNIYLIVLKDNLCKKFLNWMYSNSTIYLDRKHDRYLKSIAVLDRNI